ncbi:hypothetical protein BC834DRAFT_907912, partial [Gloeopeniophorella convolvens]
MTSALSFRLALYVPEAQISAFLELHTTVFGEAMTLVLVALAASESMYTSDSSISMTYWGSPVLCALL